VIGAGGIDDVGSALDFFAVGAEAVQVGTASFADPTTALRVLEGLQERANAPAGRPARWGPTAVGSS
jgi:dihydroorotate dehydrogenase (NAD+) catalytic subunit